METEYIINQLESNRDVFKTLFENVTEDLIVWKPGENKWNLLEIVCHLYDEEREDFKTRVGLVLNDPSQELPKFNPLDWVKDRDYGGQDFDTKVNDFLKERTSSIEWLRSLKDPGWDNAYQHPRFGPMSAKLFLNNWLAHDYLHIRQINKNKYLFLKNKVDTELKYAGDW